MIKRAIAALLIPFASPALAEGFLLGLPIDCDLNSRACYIQQYMDHDPGPSSADYRCAGLTYNGHNGTDFALPTRADMHRGVNVIAAAPGTVIRTRGDTPDTTQTSPARACGNGVVIAHKNGWETQYCHLRQGSLRVHPGQEVNTGAVLGQVGQSGHADFPHLHFSVRKDGQHVDPFAPDATLNCTDTDPKSLWTDPPAYRPGGLVDIGLAPHVPDYPSVKAGTAARNVLKTSAKTLTVFGYTYGTRAGDILQLRLIGPKGTVVDEDITLPEDRALTYRAAGEKRGWFRWPSGAYTGTVSLLRQGRVIDSQSITQTLRR